DREEAGERVAQIEEKRGHADDEGGLVVGDGIVEVQLEDREVHDEGEEAEPLAPLGDALAAGHGEPEGYEAHEEDGVVDLEESQDRVGLEGQAGRAERVVGEREGKDALDRVRVDAALGQELRKALGDRLVDAEGFEPEATVPRDLLAPEKAQDGREDD